MFEAVAAAFGPRTMVFRGRADRHSDSTGSDIVKAYVLGDAWVGVTEFALAWPSFDAALAVLAETYGPPREVSLDERRAAIVGADTLDTFTIDIKLAQLWSETLMMIDVISRAPGAPP